MNEVPEQAIVNLLESSGYSTDSIISYLEAMVEKEWANSDFAECGPGERMTFGVCRKVGESEKSESDKVKSPKEPEKTPMEEKLGKAAKAQGSDVTNNKKVMIDGRAYGWAIQGGKPIMVEWGKVAGEKKVGPKKSTKTREQKGTRPSKAIGGRIKGLEEALEKQTTESGRRSIQAQIDDLKK